MTEVEALQAKIARLKERLAQVEAVIEDRSREIYLANVQLESQSAYLEKLYRGVPEPLLVFDEKTRIESLNDAAAKLLGWTEEELKGQPCSEVFTTPPAALLELVRSSGAAPMRQEETEWKARNGTLIPVLFSATRFDVQREGEPDQGRTLGVALDLRERKKLELSLRQAQKLESVGRLAAGVAHEINTPVQFVSDSLHFVGKSIAELAQLIDLYRLSVGELPQGQQFDAIRERLLDAEEAIDLEYLQKRLPAALERCTDGLSRVAGIVRSMKEFAHPEQKDMLPVNLNRAIQSTLVIAHNEYKYVADVVTELDEELPDVVCHGGDINQVVLNLLVNASHAIEDVVKGTKKRGHITVKTRADDDAVLIVIADDGKGIPADIAPRLYDPFFTTKPVGKGTGQGLSIARTVVEERHGGKLWFESQVGKGTTFFIRLPLKGKAQQKGGLAA